MPLALVTASLSMVVPCSVRTWCGMICTLAGSSDSLVPVLPTPGTWLSGGPDVLLFGPLPSSGGALLALAGAGAGFVRCAVRDVRRVVLDEAAAALRFGAGVGLGACT